MKRGADVQQRTMGYNQTQTTHAAHTLSEELPGQPQNKLALMMLPIKEK